MKPIELIMETDDAEREAKAKILLLSDNALERTHQIVREFAKVIIYEKEIKRLTKELEDK